MKAHAIVTGLMLFAFASASARTWDPKTAVADAERDIASGKIRFCYIGGYVSHAPGVPDRALDILSHYPRIRVGPQGCIQDEQSPIRAEYARQYNARMWKHVSSHVQSSNQSLEPTAGRHDAQI
jgi:hypothetical protein